MKEIEEKGSQSKRFKLQVFFNLCNKVNIYSQTLLSGFPPLHPLQQFAFVPGAHETPAASQLPPVGSATGAATGEVGAVGVVGSATGAATGDPVEIQVVPFQLHPVAFLHVPPLVWMEH